MSNLEMLEKLDKNIKDKVRTPTSGPVSMPSKVSESGFEPRYLDPLYKVFDSGLTLRYGRAGFIVPEHGLAYAFAMTTFALIGKDISYKWWFVQQTEYPRNFAARRPLKIENSKLVNGQLEFLEMKSDLVTHALQDAIERL